MKTFRISLSSIFVLFYPIVLFSQQYLPNDNLLKRVGPIPIAPNTENCISAKERNIIENKLALTRSQLIKENKLKATLVTDLKKKASSLKLSWPVSRVPNDTLFFNNWTITNFLDLNKNTSVIQDYNCGTRTYDGHNGIDIALFPFDWYQTENNLSQAIAAAPGVIIGKDDGNYSKNCSFNNTNWNAVYVQHADGSVAWYGHLKKGTLTTKAVGETINTGDYIGITASSGVSTGPHLHFELHNNTNNPIEPFVGSCNTTNTDSLWIKQKMYYEPEINLLATHPSLPVYMGCGDADYPNFQNEFHSTSKIYFTCYIKELMNNDSINFKIENTNNQTILDSRFKNTGGDFWAAWYYWYMNASDIGPEGNYIFKIILKNKIVKTHGFKIKNNGFKKISILGDCIPGTAWENDIPMYTSNGLDYQLKKVYLKKGECKFRKNANWIVNWGVNSFPNGTGYQDGPNIQVPEFGFYDISFNSNTGSFQFTLAETIQIGIIGTSVNGAWNTDFKLKTSDGVNYTINSIFLNAGELKFRMNNTWDANWGANTFPTGTGVNNGPNIPIANKGNYEILFNRKTGIYTFNLLKDTLPFLKDFSPKTGRNNTLVTIYGKNLNNISSVKFGGVNAKQFSLLNDSTLQAMVDSGASGNIQVISGNTTLELSGFIFANKIQITNFMPKEGKKGDTLSIFGQNFGTIKSIKIGGFDAQNFWKIDNSTIKVVVGNGGNGEIIVINETDTAATNTFTFNPRNPFYISSFSPSSGSEGDTIQIVLNNTTGVSKVLFGNTSASNFWIIDQNKIGATLGKGSSGNIYVMNKFDTAFVTGFNYIIYPLQIVSFYPKEGKKGDTILITLNKTNGIQNVKFGGIDAISYWILNNLTLQATIGKGASGAISVCSQTDTVQMDGFKFIQNTGLTSQNNQGIEIFPNPFNSRISISEIPINYSDIQIFIRDLQGRLLKEFSSDRWLHEIAIPTDELAQGTYILQIKHQSDYYTKRIIKY